MNRLALKTLQIVFDFTILAFSFWFAVLLRFEGFPHLEIFKRLIFIWPYAIVLQYSILILFGVPRFSWRYIGLREILRILAGLTISTGLLLALRYGVPLLPWKSGYLKYVQIPTGVILINLFLAFFSVSGMRILRRIIGERSDSKRHAPENTERQSIPTLLVGAGQMGAMMAKELSTRTDLGILPIGFLDDDPTKQQTIIQGVTVLGPLSKLGEIAKRLNIKQVLITIAATPGPVIRNISQACDRQGIEMKIIPGLSELVMDKLSITNIRNVTIDDLLRRAPVELDRQLIDSELKGTVALVTGAGGSIGSELCRQLCHLGVRRLVLVEQAENALYEIHRSLNSMFPQVAIEPCIADVCDKKRLWAIFNRFHPDHVFHAAAHKHVPMMEYNPAEAVKNNVFGTKTVADVASQNGVRRFVMISTDKAVNPTSVMGATKRLAELYVQAKGQSSASTCFVAVRFGNVLGSAGSVIPLFKSQIKAGGPVTVTHPEMRRYFMTIPEASQLVLQAGAMGKGGEIFVLDMGDPVFIKDLAKDLIRLSGLTPEKDIQIQFTGLRPGEKLFEELSLADENADRTHHPKIFVGKLTSMPLDAVEQAFEDLRRLIFADEEPSPTTVRAAIHAIIPEYNPMVPPPSPSQQSELIRLASLPPQPSTIPIETKDPCHL